MKIKKINKVAFIGIGLINSSLARDLRNSGFYNYSSAFSRTKKTREILRKLKIVDQVDETIEDTVRDADLVIVGVPVAAYSGVLKQISCHLKENAIVTDVGSVKKSIIKIAKYLPNGIDFIPGVIAGTENSGPEAGFKGLFKMDFVY